MLACFLSVLPLVTATVDTWNWTLPAKDTDWPPLLGPHVPVSQDPGHLSGPSVAAPADAAEIALVRNNWSMMRTRRAPGTIARSSWQYCDDDQGAECCPRICENDWPFGSWDNFTACIAALPSHCYMKAKSHIRRNEFSLCVYDGYRDWGAIHAVKVPAEISRINIPWRKMYLQLHNASLASNCHFPLRTTQEYTDVQVALSVWTSDSREKSEQRWDDCSHTKEQLSDWLILKGWEVNVDYYSHGYMWLSLARLWAHAMKSANWADGWNASKTLGVHIKMPQHCKTMEHWPYASTNFDWKFEGWVKGQNYTWLETNRSKAVYDYGDPLTWQKWNATADALARGILVPTPSYGRLLSVIDLDHLFAEADGVSCTGWTLMGVIGTAGLVSVAMLARFHGSDKQRATVSDKKVVSSLRSYDSGRRLD